MKKGRHHGRGAAFSKVGSLLKEVFMDKSEHIKTIEAMITHWNCGISEIIRSHMTPVAYTRRVCADLADMTLAALIRATRLDADSFVTVSDCQHLLHTCAQYQLPQYVAALLDVRSGCLALLDGALDLDSELTDLAERVATLENVVHSYASSDHDALELLHAIQASPEGKP